MHIRSIVTVVIAMSIIGCTADYLCDDESPPYAYPFTHACIKCPGDTNINGTSMVHSYTVNETVSYDCNISTTESHVIVRHHPISMLIHSITCDIISSSLSINIVWTVITSPGSTYRQRVRNGNTERRIQFVESYKGADTFVCEVYDTDSLSLIEQHYYYVNRLSPCETNPTYCSNKPGTMCVSSNDFMPTCVGVTCNANKSLMYTAMLTPTCIVCPINTTRSISWTHSYPDVPDEHTNVVLNGYIQSDYKKHLISVINTPDSLNAIVIHGWHSWYIAAIFRCADNENMVNSVAIRTMGSSRTTRWLPQDITAPFMIRSYNNVKWYIIPLHADLYDDDRRPIVIFENNRINADYTGIVSEIASNESNQSVYFNPTHRGNATFACTHMIGGKVIEVHYIDVYRYSTCDIDPNYCSSHTISNRTCVSDRYFNVTCACSDQSYTGIECNVPVMPTTVSLHQSIGIVCPIQSLGASISWMLLHANGNIIVASDGKLTTSLYNMYYIDSVNTSRHALVINAVSVDTVGSYVCSDTPNFTTKHDIIVAVFDSVDVWLPTNLTCNRTVSYTDSVIPYKTVITWIVHYSNGITLSPDRSVLYFDPKYVHNDTIMCEIAVNGYVSEVHYFEVTRFTKCDSDKNYCSHLPNSVCVPEINFDASCVCDANHADTDCTASVTSSTIDGIIHESVGLICPIETTLPISWAMTSNVVGDMYRNQIIVLDGILVATDRIRNSYSIQRTVSSNYVLVVQNIQPFSLGRYICADNVNFTNSQAVTIIGSIRYVKLLPTAITCDPIIGIRDPIVTWSSIPIATTMLQSFNSRMIVKNDSRLSISADGLRITFNSTYQRNETFVCEVQSHRHSDIRIPQVAYYDVYRYSLCDTDTNYCAQSKPRTKCVSDSDFVATCACPDDRYTGNKCNIRVSVPIRNSASNNICYNRVLVFVISIIIVVMT